MSSVRSFSLSVPESSLVSDPIPDNMDTPELPTYHPKFYIQEGMATFLVENRLFKVHHHFLVRESEKFRSIIMRPRDPSDDTIPLSDVTCLEFESLLGFFYNGMHEDYNPTLDEWLDLLSISTNYGLDKVRQQAISQVENHPREIDPIEKILLAERHGIDKWLAPAYAELCGRAEPLQVCEAERLGLVTTVKLARAREVYRSSVVAAEVPPVSPHWHLPSSIPDDPVFRVNAEKDRRMAIVRQVFWPEPIVSTVSEQGGGKKRKGNSKK